MSRQKSSHHKQAPSKPAVDASPVGESLSSQHSSFGPNSFTELNAHNLLKMQRKLGNQAVMRMIENRLNGGNMPIQRLDASTFQNRLNHDGGAAFDQYVREGHASPDANRAEVLASDGFQRWLQPRILRFAEAASNYIKNRLTQAQAGQIPASLFRQAGDEAWVGSVVEHLTGVSYNQANPQYGGSDAWRRELGNSGNYPVVLVCDQISEVIQRARGFSNNFTGGLSGHYRFYLGQGGFSGSRESRIQPGASVFHIVDYDHTARDFIPGFPPRFRRAPIAGQWSASAEHELWSEESELMHMRRRARRTIHDRQQEDRNQYRREHHMGRGRPLSDEAEHEIHQLTGAERGEQAEIENARRDFARRLATIYHIGKRISHENIILRVRRRGNQPTHIQLFDFDSDRHVAEESGLWMNIGYIGHDRRGSGYREVAYLNAGVREADPSEEAASDGGASEAGNAAQGLRLNQARGSAHVSINHEGSAILDFDGNNAQGFMMPAAHYMWAFAGMPYADVLDARLLTNIMAEPGQAGPENMQMDESGAAERTSNLRGSFS